MVFNISLNLKFTSCEVAKTVYYGSGYIHTESMM